MCVERGGRGGGGGDVHLAVLRDGGPFQAYAHDFELKLSAVLES